MNLNEAFKDMKITCTKEGMKALIELLETGMENTYINASEEEPCGDVPLSGPNSIIQWDIIEYGNITDEEIDAFGVFTESQKEIIKDMYAKHRKGVFPNPACALY